MSTVQRAPGRRVAERPEKTPVNWVRWTRMLLGAALLVGLALTVLAAVGIGPDWLDRAGAITISTGYTVLLAARTGGRPWVFGALALVIGLATVVLDQDAVRNGAAVLTTASTAVLAVMVTVPARRFRHAVREMLIALAVAGVGAMAVIGFRPVVSLDRFEYVSLALSFLLVVLLVLQLGGVHSLGRRGLVVLLIGAIAVAVTITYAELLRRYGSQSVVDDVLDAVAWVRDTFGAVPRPMLLAVGVPALLWGTHMRARRRQGWWVSAFGVAATVSVAGLMVNPDTGWIEAGLIIAYSVIPGLVVGFVVVRADLLLTGPRGRRARHEEAAGAVRPEPSRLQPLL